MLTKKATDSLAIVILGWTNRLKGIFLIPIVLHALGLATYGAYIEITANVLLLTGFAQLALGQAVLRYGSSVEEQEIARLRDIFWSPILFSTVIALLLCAALVFAAALLSQLFLAGKYTFAIALAAPLIVSESVGALLQTYLNSRRRLKQAALFRFLKDILPYLSFVGAIYAWHTLTPGIVAMTTTSWAVVTIMWTILGLEVGRPSFNWTIVKTYLRFSWPFAAMAVTEGNLAAVPRLVVPYFLGTRALGAFNIVYVLARFLAATDEPFVVYLNSHLPRLWDAGNRARAAVIWERCELYFLALASLGVVMLAGVLGPALRLWFPVIHQALGPHEFLILVTLGIFGLGYGLNELTWVAARLEERPLLILSSSVVALAIDIPLTLVLAHNFGLAGTAVAQAATVVFVQFLLRRALALRPSSDFFAASMKIVAAAVLTAIVLVLVPKDGLPTLVLWSVVATAMFFGLVHLSRAVTMSEVSELLLRRNGSQ